MAIRLPPVSATIHQPEMNKTEQAYAWYLDGLKRAGDILIYQFGAITLRIGNDCRYTPDFFVVTKELIVELHEVKGFMREDALVKLKAAAAIYPFIFRLVHRVAGMWDIKEIKP